ncbi:MULTISPECIES: beta-ketoacyl-[acyl-carrier-protein] synthase family protein [unclassified Streptomyces]|uniref:beta-ketoacyl-[acyl-carrier-protein] synthase family protein n=1 Tax=unclassified Streptomyces TaxID=2593676 RepID=UPI0022B71DCC|nr:MULTISPECIES: beta-ketoacyl-[acyl-carrier-protein] synthase family protein [unclassified Streptomyces]MCZ7416828.1 beta-ketoacyl-[acyl-carrier-protein] synthase family protein [Streptomyces sp. WMMC897]MCZ7433354.1 beta-ketoacyl-[acyl-carrier-protein] synthase family protein [Streptomyces sp. WMMC1477]
MTGRSSRNGGDRQDIAVTGLGLVTPAGIGLEASWDGLCAGVGLAAKDPELDGLPVDFACRVPGFDGVGLLGRRLTWRIDRFIQLALVAAREAVADAGFDAAAPDWDGPRVATVLGVASNGCDRWPTEYRNLAEGRVESISPTTLTRSLPNMAAGEVSMDLRSKGPCLTTSSACASGATAIGVARDLLRAGACDIAITGGAECARVPMGSAAFYRMRALSTRRHDPASASRPFDAERDGFVLGEGAGVLILERQDHARARNARIRGYLSGYGATCDGHHYATPDPDGDGARRAILTALQDAGAELTDVDHVNAHGTSTPQGDRIEAAVLADLFGGAPPPVTSVKGVLGHTLGAAGAVEAAVTVLTLQRGLIPPTANLDRLDEGCDIDVVTKVPRRRRMSAALSNAFGFGGQNAVLFFRAA